MSELILDVVAIHKFFASKGVATNFSAGMQGIAVVRDGEIVGGVLYDDYNKQNIWMHVAGTDGVQWATKTFLKKVFEYPFIQLGVKRITGWVEASNMRARRLDEHLGFKHEATLKGAAQDGGDVMLYVMWREDCRFI